MNILYLFIIYAYLLRSNSSATLEISTVDLCHGWPYTLFCRCTEPPWSSSCTNCLSLQSISVSDLSFHAWCAPHKMLRNGTFRGVTLSDRFSVLSVTLVQYPPSFTNVTFLTTTAVHLVHYPASLVRASCVLWMRQDTAQSARCSVAYRKPGLLWMVFAYFTLYLTQT